MLPCGLGHGKTQLVSGRLVAMKIRRHLRRSMMPSNHKKPESMKDDELILQYLEQMDSDHENVPEDELLDMRIKVLEVVLKTDPDLIRNMVIARRDQYLELSRDDPTFLIRVDRLNDLLNNESLHGQVAMFLYIHKTEQQLLRQTLRQMTSGSGDA